MFYATWRSIFLPLSQSTLQSLRFLTLPPRIFDSCNGGGSPGTSFVGSINHGRGSYYLAHINLSAPILHRQGSDGFSLLPTVLNSIFPCAI